MDDRHRQELLAIVALLAGLFLALALLPVGWTGPVGRGLGSTLHIGLGIGAWLIPLFGIAAGLAGFGWLGTMNLRRLGVLFGGLAILLPYGIALAAGITTSGALPADFADATLPQRLAGLVPAMVAIGVTAVIGAAGAVILGLIALSGITILTFDWHPFRRLERSRGAADASGDTVAGELNDHAAPAAPGSVSRGIWDDIEEEPEADQAPAVRPPRRRAKKNAPASADDAFDELPPLDLLTPADRAAVDAGEEELERLGQVLEETLATFRVEGHTIARTTGPVVTQYEVAPGSGVKVGRIAALADDLALAMRAQSIRIVAPIPGKAAVGVEVPNPTPRIVRVREILDAPEWERHRGALPLVLGKDLEGRPVIADLSKMPHLLIAGATGSGKSVCINAIITSLIYLYTPSQLRMLMIDPKMVELSGYNVLPHLRHPVVTNNRQAAQALKWAVHEMERRYELFNANGARNLGDFNRKVEQERELVWPEGSARRKAQGAKGSSEGLDAEELDLTYDEGMLPYVVVIVDELADLMMTVQGEVEKPLAMLAQKARATGIHLILATQRPSVNVITGLIKANFPSRIAFRVASKVDSRTILDQNGAEALLGNGDMLFLPPGKSEPTRVQGAFIATEETEAVTDWYAERRAARDAALEARGRVAPESREENIIAVVEAMEAAEAAASGAGAGAEGSGDRDALFREAAETCLQNQLGSTSLLQRKLRIGYGRAARIIDQLYEAGILGPPDGSKPREVLIGAEQLDEYCR